MCLPCIGEEEEGRKRGREGRGEEEKGNEGRRKRVGRGKGEGRRKGKGGGRREGEEDNNFTLSPLGGLVNSREV